MNEGPKISVYYNEGRENDEIVENSVVALGIAYLHRLLWLLGSIQGFFPLLASHQLLDGFQS